MMLKTLEKQALNFHRPQSLLRIKILDSLRGVATLIVCFHHLFEFNINYIEANVTKLTFYGLEFISHLQNEAVLFFFVLSGFAIGLSLKGKNLGDRDILNNYIYRRFKRIIPIYWIALATSVVLGAIMGHLDLYNYSF